VLAFAKRVVAAMELGDMAKEPYMIFPLLPLAHLINVSLPGQVGPRARGLGGRRGGVGGASRRGRREGRGAAFAGPRHGRLNSHGQPMQREQAQSADHVQQSPRPRPRSPANPSTNPNKPQEPPIDQAPEDCRLWDPSLVDRNGGVGGLLGVVLLGGGGTRLPNQR
jgi:hypothetical protein